MIGSAVLTLLVIGTAVLALLAVCLGLPLALGAGYGYGAPPLFGLLKLHFEEVVQHGIYEFKDSDD